MLKGMQSKVLGPVRSMATTNFRFCLRHPPALRSYYEVLKVPLNSTGKEIKRAFIELSKKYHPDGNSGTRDSEEFVRVCEAYKILSKRASRDHSVQVQRICYRSVPPMETSYSSKNVHNTWLKYQAAVRYKQFGYDQPVAPKANLGKGSWLAKGTGMCLLPPGSPELRCRFSDGEVIRMPFFFKRSHERRMHHLYMTGYCIILAILAFDVMSRAKQSSSNYKSATLTECP